MVPGYCTTGYSSEIAPCSEGYKKGTCGNAGCYCICDPDYHGTYGKNRTHCMVSWARCKPGLGDLVGTEACKNMKTLCNEALTETHCEFASIQDSTTSIISNTCPNASVYNNYGCNFKAPAVGYCGPWTWTHDGDIHNPLHGCSPGYKTHACGTGGCECECDTAYTGTYGPYQGPDNSPVCKWNPCYNSEDYCITEPNTCVLGDPCPGHQCCGNTVCAQTDPGNFFSPSKCLTLVPGPPVPGPPEPGPPVPGPPEPGPPVPGPPIPDVNE